MVSTISLCVWKERVDRLLPIFPHGGVCFTEVNLNAREVSITWIIKPWDSLSQATPEAMNLVAVRKYLDFCKNSRSIQIYR